MSTQISGVHVLFEKDIDESDAKKIVAAIKQLRHVLGVKTHLAPNAIDEWTIRERVRGEYREKLMDLIFPTGAKT